MNYWLMKSEPTVFGIDDLARSPGRRTAWDGVRNYQARNFMRAMHRGDQALFYHSSCPVPGVSGRIRIVREAYPDPTQFDPDDPHFDPGSRRDSPRWSAVDVELADRFHQPIPLAQMRTDPRLTNLMILRPGNRLSITPVTAAEWRCILKLADNA